jgi:hypothetical protein
MAYGYYASITVDNTKVDDTDGVDLSNFPVLISGTYDGTGGEPDLRITGSGGNIQNTDSGGNSGSVTVPADLAFYDDASQTTQYDHEVEYYDSTTGRIVIWVRIPTLLYASDTTFYMFYGDASVSSTQESVAGVWSAYTGVWHMNNDPNGGGTVYDSCGTPYNLTSHNHTSDDLVDGSSGRAINFDDENSEYLVGAAADDKTNFLDAFTLESYHYLNALNSNNVLAARTLNTDTQYFFQARSTDTAYQFRGNGFTKQWNSVGTAATGSWEYAAVVREGDSDNDVRMHINANTYSDTDAAWATGPTEYTGSPFIIAYNNYGAGPLYLDGIIQETRISNTAKTTSWLATNYNTINSPATFYTMGSETSPSVSTNKGRVLFII